MMSLNQSVSTKLKNPFVIWNLDYQSRVNGLRLLHAMNSSTIEVYRNCSHFVNALEALGAIFCERSWANQVKYNSIEN